MSPIPAVAPDPLRLDRCPKCGYALAGLPDEGTCPECGREYDQQVVVLHGWSCFPLAPITQIRDKFLFIQHPAVTLVCLHLAFLIIFWPARPVALILWPVVLIGFPTLSWIHWRNTRCEIPPSQLRMNAFGVRQLGTPCAASDVDTIRRVAAVAVFLISTVLVVYRLVFGAGWVRSMFAAIFVVMLVVALTLWRSARRRRPPGELVLYDTDDHPMSHDSAIAWANVRKLVIRPRRGGFHRLEIRGRRGLLHGICAIEIESSPEMIAALRARIERWREDAKP